MQSALFLQPSVAHCFRQLCFHRHQTSKRATPRFLYAYSNISKPAFFQAVLVRLRLMFSSDADLQSLQEVGGGGREITFGDFRGRARVPNFVRLCQPPHCPPAETFFTIICCDFITLYYILIHFYCINYDFMQIYA